MNSERCLMMGNSARQGVLIQRNFLYMVFCTLPTRRQLTFNLSHPMIPYFLSCTPAHYNLSTTMNINGLRSTKVATDSHSNELLPAYWRGAGIRESRE